MAEAELSAGKKKKKKKQAHVLALPFPFHGHVRPLLELSLQLASEGIAISFVNIPHYHSRLLSSLQPLLDCSHLPVHLISLGDDYPPPPDLRIDGSMQVCLQHLSSHMLPEIENLMHSLLEQDPQHPFTCLLADVGIPFAQLLAEKFDISRIAFWPQSAASFSYHSALASGVCLPTDELAIIDFIPGVPLHTVSDAPVILRRELVGDFIFSFVTRPFLQLKRALAVVINTVESLEAEALSALRGQGWNVLPVGPLLSHGSSESASPEQKNVPQAQHFCLDWLDRQKPVSVLYISFGTLVCLDEETFAELALGIEASSQSFLWSLRLDMVAGSQSNFMEAFMDRTKHRGLVVPWVPQLDVLSHASIGGFLTHCGWNSSLESMCRGVPMIGRPVFGEQKLNLTFLVNCWGVCLALDDEPLCRNQVQENVRALFGGPEVKEQLQNSVKKLQNIATCAIVPNGSSSNNFKLLLQLVVGSIDKLQ